MILRNRADILFHEAYSYDPKTNPYDAKAPVTVMPYMNAFHTSTEQLAGVLKKVEPQGDCALPLRRIYARECDRPGARCQGD
jgi:hypothetical protein